MGYRARLGKIAKTERVKIIGKTADEVRAIYENKCGESPYYPDEHTELYELGKYVDYSNGHPYESYYSFDIIKEMESEFHIMTKKDLEDIIADYRDKIRRNYEFYLKIINEEKITKEEEKYYLLFGAKEDEIRDRLVNFLRNRSSQWGENCTKFKLFPYSLDREKDLVQAWDYEYAIFQLVDIYRNFDWEKDYLIYSAW